MTTSSTQAPTGLVNSNQRTKHAVLFKQLWVSLLGKMLKVAKQGLEIQD
jgi:hypothetical protein